MSHDRPADPRGERATPTLGGRIRDAVEGAVDWLGEALDGLLMPAPQPVPIPVRRRPPRRR